MAHQLPGVAALTLLERGDALDDVEHRLRLATHGHGGAVLLEGSAGVGKTAFLDVVADAADALGCSVLSARGTEFETALGFGVVRQLLEPRIRALGPAARDRLLAGAAGLAGPIVTSAATGDASSRFAVLHGLYWLLARLADAAPLLLVVDDGQWLDEPSEEWLRYLLVRLDDLPVLVVLATRPVPGAAQVVDRDTHRIVLQPLGLDSVRELVTRRTGRETDATTVRACHDVTGGNPLLVRELLDSLDARGQSIDDVAADDLGGFASEPLVRRTHDRLVRLGPDAVCVADALAVLGDGAALGDLAYVAGLDRAVTSHSLDALGAADLVDDDRPASFVHPLLRTAVVEHLAPFERSQLHTRAADTLAADNADPEAIGLHLLAAQPLGRADHVTLLQRAAGTALRRGAPATAVAFLRRALAEPPEAARRAAVLRELGEAQLRDGDGAAVAHLEQAIELTDDPVGRAATGHVLANALLFRGAWEAAIARFVQAREDAGPDDTDLTARIEADLLVTTALDDRTAGQDVEVPLHELRERAATPRRRASALTLALLEALRSRGDPVPDVVASALADGAFLAAETSDSIAAVQGVDALIFVDCLDDALAFARDMVVDGERRASVLGVVAGLTHCGFAELRLGRLADAEADCRAALDLAREHGLTFTIPFIATYLATTYLAIGNTARALEVIASVDPRVELEHTVAPPTFLEARGWVRAALGDLDGAARDFRAVGAACARLLITNPNAYDWRGGLASTLRFEDPQEAERLARDNLARCEASHSERAVGIALRCVAPFTEHDDRVVLLQRSVEHLERSPARLELARSLFDLGTAIRRSGSRTGARAALLQSLQLATECGATTLAAQALDEARQTGARPRRPWTTGRAALTPAERRVAVLAAEGRTNQEIAQSLFVTTKTVKTHLGSVYRKLGISRRTELRDQLDERLGVEG